MIENSFPDGPALMSIGSASGPTKRKFSTRSVSGSIDSLKPSRRVRKRLLRSPPGSGLEKSSCGDVVSGITWIWFELSPSAVPVTSGKAKSAGGGGGVKGCRTRTSLYPMLPPVSVARTWISIGRPKFSSRGARIEKSSNGNDTSLRTTSPLISNSTLRT